MASNSGFSKKAIEAAREFVDYITLGESRRVANDVGKGIALNRSESQRNMLKEKAFSSADSVVKNAQRMNNPADKQRAFRSAQDIYRGIRKTEEGNIKGFSKTVSQNPIRRGLRVGSEITTIASIAGAAAKAFGKQAVKSAVTNSPVKSASTPVKPAPTPKNVDELIMEFNKYPTKKSYVDFLMTQGGELAKRASIARARGWDSLLDFYTRWAPL